MFFPAVCFIVTLLVAFIRIGRGYQKRSRDGKCWYVTHAFIHCVMHVPTLLNVPNTIVSRIKMNFNKFAAESLYFMGLFSYYGNAGVEKDPAAALKYFRRAAEKVCVRNTRIIIVARGCEYVQCFTTQAST